MRDARPWTYSALFGALWGAIELSLGSALHLAGFPVAGPLLGVLGLLCLITLRRLQPRPGVCLLAGVVALFLKVFTLGGLYPGPLIGIALEATLVELGMTLLGGGRLGALVAGGAALAVNPLQLAAGTVLVAGREALGAYARVGRSLVSPLVGFEPSPTLLLAAVVGTAALLGALAGAWSWRIAGRVEQRLGRRT